MDEMEEFRITFLQECEELLELLSDELSKMVEGSADDDAINGAFRAVHSIKGGAGVFGFERLINLTHTFENVLDLIRSGSLEVTEEIGVILIRSMDVTADLVNNAREGDEASVNDEEDVLASLKEIIGEDSADDATTSSSKADEPAQEIKTADTASEEEPTVEQMEVLPERVIKITFRPGEGLYSAGHDPLSIIRALSEFGSLNVEILEDRLQTIEQENITHPAYDWLFELTTSAPQDTIEDIMEFVQSYAEISIDDPGLPAIETVEGQPAQDPSPAPDLTPEASPPLAQDTAPPKQNEAPEKTDAASKVKSKAPTTLRVNLEQIDQLVNMVGEIVITQAVLQRQASYLAMEKHTGLAAAIETLSRQTNELQENVMAIRAQPVKAVFSRMSRLVRGLGQSLEKDVELVVVGEHTEVDTTVIEELAEPLTHMIRNSMDHGLEDRDERAATEKPSVGTLLLSAEHRGGRIVITLKDDGRGINRTRVLSKAREKGLIAPEAKLSGEEIDNLVFHPGFSTAEKVTDVSGRGVGMDVVRRKIQSLGGRVTVTSSEGKGTTFIITLPLTLAVMDGMIIRTGSETYIVPVPSVVEAMRIEPDQIGLLPEGGRVIQIRGEIQNVATLKDLLKIKGVTDEFVGGLVIIVETETAGRLALEVDELVGQQQVVIKSLETNYGRIDGISGGTILGDGNVALILDVDALADMNAHSTNHTSNNFHMELHT